MGIVIVQRQRMQLLTQHSNKEKQPTRRRGELLHTAPGFTHGHEFWKCQQNKQKTQGNNEN